VRAIARVDDPSLPIAETVRRLGLVAEELGVPRPSYVHMRRYVVEHRERPGAPPQNTWTSVETSAGVATSRPCPRSGGMRKTPRPTGCGRPAGHERTLVAQSHKLASRSKSK